jgi:YD repeat-containing protein
MNTTTKKAAIKPVEIKQPSGGGSFKSMGETFNADFFSGTGNYSFPIQITEARGFQPQLQLNYNSGNGNGSIGLGFSLSLSKISRRTEKGIPKYNDSDIFLFDGEELVPVLNEKDKTWFRDERNEISKAENWVARKYVPRIQTNFLLIEFWINNDNKQCYWKVTTKENVTSIYGKFLTAQIANPSDPSLVFEWLIEESIDANGNKILYTYKKENNESLLSTEGEGKIVSNANVYLESIKYGNYFDETKKEEFAFELIVDYGERNVSDKVLVQPNCNLYDPDKSWDLRKDAFSSFKSGFDIRTQRLCRHILLFYHFKGELGEKPCLIKRYRLLHDETEVVSLLNSIEVTGCRRNTDYSYEIQKVPPVHFTFSAFNPPSKPSFKKLEMEGHPIPGYLNNSDFLPVDLFAEGAPGFLFSNDTTSLYIEPLGEGKFQEPQELGKFPVQRNIQNGRLSLVDLEGDRQLALMLNPRPNGTGGFYQLQDYAAWSEFKAFPSFPADFSNPELETTSLSGNGKNDLVLADIGTIHVYTSLGKTGFSKAKTINAPQDFPVRKNGYEEELVTFADMFGDGLLHRVRISNGSVECWPCAGYGRFLEKRTLANAPSFKEGLNIKRIFLADLDGSGTTDLVYVYSDRVELFINQSGNSFSDAFKVMLPENEYYGDIDQISFADIDGTGITCLVFTKIAPVPRHYYFPFNGTVNVSKAIPDAAPIKPYLLVSINDNMGANTQLQYCSSTRFYLEDKRAKIPWITKLPFPVQVIEQVTHYDEIAKTKLVQRFKYHDGYYDPVDKEFRGFGYVESWDSQTFETYEKDTDTGPFEVQKIKEELFVAPVYTRSWYNTGVEDINSTINEYFKKQYYQGDTKAYDFPNNVFSGIPANDHETRRQAYAALKGQIIRQEVYGLDDNADYSNNLYTVTESNNEVILLQPKANQPYAVFKVNARENIHYQYERVSSDPRVQQSFYQYDDFGNPVNTCTVFLPRRSQSNAIVNKEQQELKAIASRTSFINVTDAFRRIGVACQTKSFEVKGLEPHQNGYMDYQYIKNNVFSKTENNFEDTPPFFQAPVELQLINYDKTFFWNDDQTWALPHGKLTARALIHHQQIAEFSENQIQDILNGKISDTFLQENGGYIKEEGYWWNLGLVQYYFTPANPEGFYLPTETSVPTAKMLQAVSAIQSKTTIEYDKPYHFRPIKVLQWLDAANSNDTEAIIDYTTLLPKQVTDINKNCVQVLFDPLGQVIVHCLFGKVDGKKTGSMTLYPDGNNLAEYQKRTTSSSGGPISFDDVVSQPEYYLQGAGSFFYYDLFTWVREQTFEDTGKQPMSTISLLRNDFYHQTNGSISPFSCQVSILYADGTGRALETKLLAEEGVAYPKDADRRLIMENGKTVLSFTDPRWIVSGRTVYNNKGKPCEQYLPYFSNTPYYESQQELTDQRLVPPPTLTYYDPLLRIIKIVTPKKFFSKVEFTSWEEKHYDEDDTVDDIIKDSEYFIFNYPSKVSQQEKDALDIAKRFYNTPTIKVYDVMANPFLTIENNLGAVSSNAFKDIANGSISSEQLWEELVVKGYLKKQTKGASDIAWLTAKFQPYEKDFTLQLEAQYLPFVPALIQFLRQDCLTSYFEYDILGRNTKSTDARLYYKNVTEDKDYYNFKHIYALQGDKPLCTQSADAGTEYFIANIFGNQVWSWSARNFNQYIYYDWLQRKTAIEVKGLKEDTHGNWIVVTDNWVEEFVYGEAEQDAVNNNLRGQLYRHNDQSGIVVNSLYDLQGAVLQTSRQFVLNYKEAVNWKNQVPLVEEHPYTTQFNYSALKLLLTETTPNGFVTTNSYNKAGLLKGVSVKDNNGVVHEIITDIQYNANRQRTIIRYGNASQTTYEYEDPTLRLLKLRTTRKTATSAKKVQIDVLQNISYTYDPVGNITSVEDTSFNSLFNNNQQVDAVSTYDYDALYRLTGSGGRQHPGIASNTFINNKANGDFKQSKYYALPQDTSKLETYKEYYTYDDAGNLTSIAHTANSASWTREMEICPDSNRIKQLITKNGTSITQDFAYDRSGNQKQLFLNSAVDLTWSCCENLIKAAVIQRPTEPDDADYYTYDSNEIRTRKVCERMAMVEM